MTATLALAWIAPTTLTLWASEEIVTAVWWSRGRLAHVTCGGLLLMACAYMVSARRYAIDRRLHSMAFAVPSISLAAGVLVAVGGNLADTRPPPLLLAYQAVLVVSVLLVAFDVLRRPALPTHVFVGRIAVCAGTLFVFGVLCSAYLAPVYSSCFGPAGDATLAAATSARLYTARLLCTTAAGALVVGSSIAGVVRHQRSVRSLSLLLALAAWLGARVVVDFLSQQAGYAIAGAPWEVDVSYLDALSVAAGWAHSLCNAMALATSMLVAWFLVARTDRDARALRRSWAIAWPVLPLLWLVTAQLHEPPLALTTIQAPTPVWEDVPGFEALSAKPLEGSAPDFRAWSEYSHAALLTSDQMLHVFHDGRVWTYPLGAPHAFAAAEGPLLAEISLLVDRRVTLGELRRAISQLSGFQHVWLVWQSNHLRRAASDTHGRWRFVTMSSYALGGAELIRYDPSDGEDLTHQDRVLVSRWLSRADSPGAGLFIASGNPWPRFPSDDSRGQQIPRSMQALGYPTTPRALPDVMLRDVGLGAGIVAFALLVLSCRAEAARRYSPSPMGGGPYRRSSRISRPRDELPAGALPRRVARLAWRIAWATGAWGTLALLATAFAVALGFVD